MKYAVGLDIGISSVGYAVMMLDETDTPSAILKMGSRIFDAAENPKDGSSLAAPRRNNRGMRRRLRRKRFRKEQIKDLIVKNGIMSYSDINEIYNSGKVLSDIYSIRAEALNRILTKEEFVRLLIHLSQRRGFKSNRKVDASDSKSEAGKLLDAVNKNKSLMEEKHYRTIGEMLFIDEKFAKNKRNKAEDYANTFARSEYVAEINTIFDAQKVFGNEYATDELKEDYLKIYLSQRSFDEGPGGNSPYSGKQIEKMLGKCTFEKKEFRAVKASFTFEYFSLLSKVNSLKLKSSTEKRFLTKAERDAVIALSFNKKNISYASIRKELNLPNDTLFNISYGNGDKTVEEIEKKSKFTYLNAYHTFKKAFGDSYINWSTDKKNHLGYAIALYKNDNKIAEYLSEHGFDKSEIKIALSLPSIPKAGNLSLKAMNKIIPYLEEGMIYNEACKAAGYNFKADETDKRMFLPANEEDAPELGDIRNPVVRRSISQTIKVTNAIIREFGESPCFVNIELARELSKTKKERNEIEKNQLENRNHNEEIVKELKSTFGLLQPTGQDIVKYKLWKEQNGICPYSLEPILIENLFDIGYTDIDHIIPYSISFDDTYNNKVLVLSSENRQKGNRIPMQYLTGKKKDDFWLWVDNSNLRARKKKNLLKEEITDDDISGFKKRNLQDTQYISRFMLNFLKKYLNTQPNSSGKKNTIIAVNGAATAYIRKRWRINKIRENGDTHHAVDAVVIACVTDSMIKKISEYSKHKETEFVHPETKEIKDIDLRTGEIINKFPMPYNWFRDELVMRTSNNPTRILHEKPLPNYGTDQKVEPIFVSRMPNHKVKGSAHEETIRKKYEEDNKTYSVSKVSLSSLKLTNGEIENYFNPSSDMLLYNALKQRLAMFGGNGSKAFEEPFYKPKSDGSQGPLVKKVKIQSKSTLSVPVLKGTAIADNGSMVRVDVFFVEGEGYYMVPIYVSDTVKPELPNKAIIANKPYTEWKEMKEQDFLFSLYPNDLIRIKFNKEKQFSLVQKDSTLAKNLLLSEGYFYYKKASISSASITIINNDNTYTVASLGVKRIPLIEKYHVDVLGNIQKVGKEKRMRFR